RVAACVLIVLVALPEQANGPSAHSMYPRVDMSHSSRVSGPRGQVLQVCGAVASRKMLRVVIYVSGSEFLFKSFRQYGPDQRRRGGGGTIISDGQQETV